MKCWYWVFSKDVLRRLGIKIVPCLWCIMKNRIQLSNYKAIKRVNGNIAINILKYKEIQSNKMKWKKRKGWLRRQWKILEMRMNNRNLVKNINSWISHSELFIIYIGADNWKTIKEMYKWPCGKIIGTQTKSFCKREETVNYFLTLNFTFFYLSNENVLFRQLINKKRGKKLYFYWKTGTLIYKVDQSI